MQFYTATGRKGDKTAVVDLETRNELNMAGGGQGDRKRGGTGDK